MNPLWLNNKTIRLNKIINVIKRLFLPGSPLKLNKQPELSVQLNKKHDKIISLIKSSEIKIKKENDLNHLSLAGKLSLQLKRKSINNKINIKKCLNKIKSKIEIYDK
jgi:hypothetical protein